MKVKLPTDDEAVGLIEALNAFRESRGLFPFGRVYLEKLIRLISLTEGPFKLAMLGKENSINNAEQGSPLG